MIARRVKLTERFDAKMIFTVSMHGRIADPEAARKACEEETGDVWGTFDDDGRMISQALAFHYEAFFDGVPVPCGAVGTVATLPEFRGRGGAALALGEILRTAYREGELFSSLFPFRHDFYRRVGYETVCMQNDYVFRPDALKGYRFDGEAELWHPGDPVKDYTDRRDAVWLRGARRPACSRTTWTARFTGTGSSAISCGRAENRSRT